MENQFMKEEEEEEEYKQFLALHTAALKAAQIPPLYWKSLYYKLKHEVFDAGEVFGIMRVEEEDEDEEDAGKTSNLDHEESYKVIVTRESGLQASDPTSVYLVDHAWTYRVESARQQLIEIPGLLVRMASLMGLPFHGEAPDPDIVDLVLDNMWKFNQTYQLSQGSAEEKVPVWYIMDEFGSCLQHSSQPSCCMAPLFYAPQQIAYSVLWPLQDLENGDTTTSARISACLADISSWMTAHQLKLNPSKTELLIIPGDPSPAQDLAISLSNSMISPTASARNLGVTMDNQLSFSSHVTNVTRSCRFLLYNIRRIWPFLSTQATQVLVQSLVISRLDYCNSLLAGLPLNAIRPLQMIQNAAARLVFNLPKFSHTTPLLRSLHWCPVAARIRFKALMLAYKAKNGPAPSYLKALVTSRTAPRLLRSTSTARLVPPSLREKDEVTRDYCYEEPDSLVRKCRLFPWLPTDLEGVSDETDEPADVYYETILQENKEKLPVEVQACTVPDGKVLKVYTEMKQVLDHLKHPRFHFTEQEEEADVLWMYSHIRDYKKLSEERPHVLLNQFPCETVVTTKDCLASVARRARRGRHAPWWLPTTFNLQTELPQFIRHYLQRQDRGEDNHWICKPWNLARGLDTHITNDLNYIIRQRESTPKVVCKYLEDPVLFNREEVGLVKFDIRYMVLLRSVQPLRLYAYNVFWLRFANRPFSLDHFDDYQKHYTVMNYAEGVQLKQVHYDEFIPTFENQYAE
ncbi:hypothetical protein QTP86_017634, partial [Hemibagrus guttatus]